LKRFSTHKRNKKTSNVWANANYPFVVVMKVSNMMDLRNFASIKGAL